MAAVEAVRVIWIVPRTNSVSMAWVASLALRIVIVAQAKSVTESVGPVSPQTVSVCVSQMPAKKLAAISKGAVSLDWNVLRWMMDGPPSPIA
jgi:hypothetical protein